MGLRVEEGGASESQPVIGWIGVEPAGDSTPRASGQTSAWSLGTREHGQPSKEAKQMAQKSRNRCLPPFPLEQSFGASAPATTRSAKTMSHIRSPCSGEVWRWAPKSSYFSRFSRHQAHHQNHYLPKGSLRRCRFSTIFFLRRDATYQERDAKINGAHVFHRSYVVLRILRLMDGQRFVSSPQTSYRRSAALRRALALCSSLGQTRSTSWLVIFLYGGTADWSAIKKLHLSG